MRYKPYCYLVTALLLGCTLWGCAQSKTGMTGNTIRVYYWQRLPGTIAVDPETGAEQAPKTDTVLLIYSETVKKDITWLYAWKHGAAYKIFSQPVMQEIAVGADKKTGAEIKLSAATGKSVQHLQLVPTSETVALHPPAGSTGVWLVGTYKGKQFLQPAEEGVEIVPLQLPQ